MKNNKIAATTVSELKTYKTNLEQVSLVREKTDYKRVKVQSSKDLYLYGKQFYHGDIDIYESVFLVLLNRVNNTIGYAKISQGGITGTVVDIKIIMKYAIDSLAFGVILMHNHPSGNLKPSDADIRITKKVKEALKLMDVSLLDHLIITEESYTSLADEGLM